MDFCLLPKEETKTVKQKTKRMKNMKCFDNKYSLCSIKDNDYLIAPWQFNLPNNLFIELKQDEMMTKLLALTR
jgi:hypothetical protein